MANLVDLARMYATGTGTGPVTLTGAVPGYRSFSAAGLPNGAVVSYVLISGADTEIGKGTYNSGTLAFARTTVLGSTTGAALALTGNCEIAITALANDIVVTKADIGLGNVNDTADSAKPVSTAQAAAIAAGDALQVTKAGDTMTGQLNIAVPSGVSPVLSLRRASVGYANLAVGSDGSFLITDFANTVMLYLTTGGLNLPGMGDVKGYVDAAAALLAPKASPALTGTPTTPTPARGAATAQIATAALIAQMIKFVGSYTIADDAAQLISMPEGAQGCLVLFIPTSQSQFAGIAYIRNDSGAPNSRVMCGGPNFAAGLTASSGTTGVDGNVTCGVSASGVFFLENRAGLAKNFTIICIPT